MSIRTKIGNWIAGRGYVEIANPQNKAFASWRVDTRSEDMDIWMAHVAMLPRSRDMFKKDPLIQKWREVMMAGVFSEAGIILRLPIKETEDRIIHTAAEKSAIRAYEREFNEIKAWADAKAGRSHVPYSMLREHGNNGSRMAQVKVGDPDLFAIQLISEAWKEWREAEFCDIRGERNYHTLRQLRLIHAMRDGDCFIRMIRDPKINKFGFTLQHINAEFCDRWLNCTLPNGNEIRMGIERQWTPHGLGKIVAFYFLKRQRGDWQYSMDGMFGSSPSDARHVRVDAGEIVHYARVVDAEGTRPAPWLCASMHPSHLLNEYTLAEVIAARAEAKHIGVLSSDVAGAIPDEDPDPRKSGLSADNLKDGALLTLPPYVKYDTKHGSHPTGNFMQFSQEVIRRISAGLPAGNYSELANDYAAINFSAGRLQRLTSDSILYMIQRFDIDKAEVPIFRAWLLAALENRVIALPLVKFKKFNVAVFQGPRTPGVDPMKDVNADAFEVANNFNSRTNICARRGLVFGEVIFQNARDEKAMEELGLDTNMTASKPMPVNEVGAASEGETTMAPNNTTKPKKAALELAEDRTLE